jgi:ABC-type transport system substrate-binding protein
VLSGSNLACCDTNPPGSAVARALKTSPSQVSAEPGGIAWFVSFNYKIPPFNNINIRKAIGAAMNRQAMLLSLGGAFAGSPATGFIPPGVPGYSPREGSQFDWNNRPPEGDSALARRYMLKAKAQGVPVSSDGKYTGGQTFALIGWPGDPASKAALIMQSQLQDMGFNVKVQLVTQNTYYTKYCEATAPRIAPICVNGNATRDFADAIGIFPIFETPGINFYPLDSTVVNQAIARAKVTTEPRARAVAWGKANDAVLSTAIALPYAYGQSIVVTSKNVSVKHPAVESGASIDFSFTHLK